MRSEPVNPVRAKAHEAHRQGEAASPAAAGLDDFEASLQRAGRRRQRPGDEPETAGPQTGQAPQPQQAAGSPPPARPAEAPPSRWAPLPLAAPDAAARQLHRLAVPDSAGEPGHWQLHITEAGLPLQRLDLQRSAAGPLTVRVGAAADALQPQHAARLRQRLARSGARVAFGGPATDEETR